MRRSDFLSLADEYASVAALFIPNLHVASLYKRGILLARATNRVGSRSRGVGYSDRTIHAERNVLRSVDLSMLRGATLVVVRVGRYGELLASPPCRECRAHIEKTMRKYGLRNVYYS